MAFASARFWLKSKCKKSKRKNMRRKNMKTVLFLFVIAALALSGCQSGNENTNAAGQNLPGNTMTNSMRNSPGMMNGAPVP